jgi:hypothetical protein
VRPHASGPPGSTTRLIAVLDFANVAAIRRSPGWRAASRDGGFATCAALGFQGHRSLAGCGRVAAADGRCSSHRRPPRASPQWSYRRSTAIASASPRVVDVVSGEALADAKVAAR